MSALQNTPAITPEIVAEHGLTPDEYQTVFDIMGREPNMTELGIFSVMWSEHCSYKSSPGLAVMAIAWVFPRLPAK